MMHRNKSVSAHNFAMSPRADIPRSRFKREWTHKTSFGSGYLIPIVVDEVLPGDSFSIDATIFARLATPIVPTMDNLHLDTFFFFVPNRLVWDHWEDFIGGGAADPDSWDGTSPDYIVPQVVSPVDGWDAMSIGDYFGLPTKGQITLGATLSCSALPFRAYNLIWNEWFRDQNLQDPVTVSTDDGPDSPSLYGVWTRNKRHDYFTSCLPAPQRGDAVLLPLGSTAPIFNDFGTPTVIQRGADPTATGNFYLSEADPAGDIKWNHLTGTETIGSVRLAETGGVLDQYKVDLSDATSATINAIRQAFQVQKLLERDARGGGRYIEQLYSHFGVRPPDYRLQRPEYIGGGSQLIQINPVAQTAQSGTTPQGNLSAVGTVLHRPNGISYAATEHGYIIGLMMVRADLTYQQGMRKMWSRSTRFDFYFPVFAHLGEQAVLRKEIYCLGDDGTSDDVVFGYQERWAEYRYFPSQITGLLRSTNSAPLDQWHYAQKFASAPVLNGTFIHENPPLDRTLAVTDPNFGSQLIADMFFAQNITRAMPMYSVPGLIDHF